MTFDFIEYLAAKKTVDDRALNRRVWQTLADLCPIATRQRPLQVLEVAGGIGTMLERAVDWGLLTNADYTILDCQADYLAAARERLPQWASRRGFQVNRLSADHLLFARLGHRLTVKLIVGDVFDFITAESGRHHWDLVVAHAFLDLVDLPSLLPGLMSRLKPGGLYYFSLNFDGQTILLPAIDPGLDEAIISRYHQQMDEQQPTSGSQTGRRLFEQLSAAGAEVLAAGSSDWVVHPGPAGYPATEAFFLHCIIDTLEASLRDQLTADWQSWFRQRHQQIDREELVYIAHQLDFVGSIKSDC